MKITYIISGIDKALPFEWMATELKKTNRLEFILLGKRNSALGLFLKDAGISYCEIEFSGKFSLLISFFKVLVQLIKIRPEVVHTHLFEANIIGLTASRLLGTRKRVFTRHHSTIHHIYYPSGLKWDRWCHWMATDIVAISKNIEHILMDWEGVPARKVHLIYHGFDFDEFQMVSSHRVEVLREHYQIAKDDYPVIGVISRYTEWKGIQYIIPAFARLLVNYPNARLILANSHGDFERQLRRQLESLEKSRYTEIKYEPDIAALYRLFDIFIHVPVDAHSEAFGQVYVESLLSGIPSIFTASGIAPEFIINDQNALLVPFKDEDAIYSACQDLLSNLEKAQKLVENGRSSVEVFRLEHMIKGLNSLYLS